MMHFMAMLVKILSSVALVMIILMVVLVMIPMYSTKALVGIRFMITAAAIRMFCNSMVLMLLRFRLKNQGVICF